MEQNIRPILGVTIGDINGIGPEVILKTFQDKKFSIARIHHFKSITDATRRDK
jgi:4-hydroxy-L-threonine phosphate dehydrogenase PdxA